MKIEFTVDSTKELEILREAMDQYLDGLLEEADEQDPVMLERAKQIANALYFRLYHTSPY